MSTSSTSSTPTPRNSQPSSNGGSPMPAVDSIALVVRDGAEGAAERVRAVAADAGVEVVDGDGNPNLVVVLGGDGTMLRALGRYLGTGIPALGLNERRVGSLTTVPAEDLEASCKRALLFEFKPIPPSTVEV